MRTLAIIQARMGSSRFPGKVVSDIKGKPMIVHMLERLKRCQTIDQIAIATSNSPADYTLVRLAEHEGVESFAGSEHDVLDRYYQAARRYQPELVVRLTGDCPLIDPEVTDLVIRRHIECQKDYTSNTVTRSYPRGLDTEVMNYQTLVQAAKEAVKPYEREHVTPYIYEHPERFSIEQVTAEPGRSEPSLRLTVDTKEDFELVLEIFNCLYETKPSFSIDHILALLKQRPELKKINAHIKQKMMPPK